MHRPALLLLACAAATFAQVRAEPATKDGVLAAERALCHAYQTNDVAYLRSHVAPEYQLTDAKGVITTREDDLHDATSGKAAYTLFENRDMQVTLLPTDGAHAPDVAVVRGKTYVQGKYGGQPLDIIVQFTDTMIRRGGIWQLAAGHVSRLKN